MQAAIPLTKLTFKQKIIAMAIGVVSAIALSVGLGGAPAGASSSYGGVDLSAVSVDATSFSEHTTYSAKSLIVVYEEVNYTNSVSFEQFSLNTLDLSQADHAKKHYGGYDNKDYGKKDW